LQPTDTTTGGSAGNEDRTEVSENKVYTKSLTPPSKSSIEHVMPQTLTSEWHEMLGESADEVHSAFLHTVGNLTLTGYNPELGNRSYAEKRITFAQSHFELNRYFSDHGCWTWNEIEDRAKALLKIAIQLWPRPEIAMIEPAAASDKSAPAAFHGDCVKLAQQHLGVRLSKLSQTRYESGDGRIRLMCAVSVAHRESGDIIRLLGGKDGPDLTGFNIGSAAHAAVS